MVKGIIVHEVGGPEVLKWENIEVKEPREGEVKIRHTAVGINFVDVNYRKGLYSTKTPFIPGVEAAAVVTDVGPGLTGLQVGDRVAYAGPRGAYVEERIISADKLVPLPNSVGDVVAASIMIKGMTAQMLLRRVFKVKKGHKIFVHAAAGGVGSLLVQWGRSLGATVIAAVCNEEKAVQAKEDGADHVITYSQENFVDRVKEITEGAGVEVVYDAVGKDTLKGSLNCLGLWGCLVSYGQASGAPDPIPVSVLQPKSLFLTRPSLFHYIGTRDELLETAGELFAAVATGNVGWEGMMICQSKHFTW
ncbi:unnamed protein product [Sphagnum jensenii]|uniref:Enoyl reductase (ER) domain-containing protein n=1 Tax=Sphagnum jensenii TaxID=128206 RepID=A0ABP1A5D4_9BRYO